MDLFCVFADYAGFSDCGTKDDGGGFMTEKGSCCLDPLTACMFRGHNLTCVPCVCAGRPAAVVVPSLLLGVAAPAAAARADRPSTTATGGKDWDSRDGRVGCGVT